MNDFMPDENPKLVPDKSHFNQDEKLGKDFCAAKGILRPAESTDDTIKRNLAAYDIGQKLRHLRLRKKIALIDLGKHTGLSASMLSQLENGKLIPTLPTLARIAMVFDVGLEFFFGEKRSKRAFTIVRAKERMSFPEVPDSPVPGYYFEVLSYGTVERSLSAYLAEFPSLQPDRSREHSHDGAEFFHGLSGVIAIRYQGEEYSLEAGDSVYFDASELHSYRGDSGDPARAIVVTTPPRL